ncbi:MAG: AraC family transcriptional regulator [Kosmotogaceae bacterium]|nr:AraC family transcriptional regulator [Kosmotogaceae bacterium]
MNEFIPDRLLHGVYISRINEVMDYIEDNLTESLTLDELSDVAGFSKYHFHRIFYAFVGETLSQFIWRIRLGKAAALLANDPTKTVAEVADECGFASGSSLSRSFKKRFGMNPLQWKNEKSSKSNSGVIESNLGIVEDNVDHSSSFSHLYNRSIDSFSRRMNMGKKAERLDIVNFEESTVAYVRYIGPYAGDERLFETLFNKLCSWAGPRGFLEQKSARFLIIYHDNPEVTEEEKLRLSVCITVPQDTRVDGDIGKMIVPAGEYAVAHFELDSTEYAQAWDWVYGVWLPESGYIPDDRPSFEMYPDVESSEEGKKVVEICVPIRST